MLADISVKTKSRQRILTPIRIKPIFFFVKDSHLRFVHAGCRLRKYFVLVCIIYFICFDHKCTALL